MILAELQSVLSMITDLAVRTGGTRDSVNIGFKSEDGALLHMSFTWQVGSCTFEAHWYAS